jgi:hypothetical protein
LEAIFPLHPRAVVTLADIHHILANLPKNLPEAFDQALSRIYDKRYGNSPFKLVAISERPLKLDELVVALTVVPGDLQWDVTRLPSATLSVVYLCGENLFEVDEEHRTVHFTHHSALTHLLSPPDCTESSSLHFGPEDAEEYMGSVCTTYLNYSLFDLRLSRAPDKVRASQVSQKAVETVSSLVARSWAVSLLGLGETPGILMYLSCSTTSKQGYPKRIL